MDTRRIASDISGISAQTACANLTNAGYVLSPCTIGTKTMTKITRNHNPIGFFQIVGSHIDAAGFNATLTDPEFQETLAVMLGKEVSN